METEDKSKEAAELFEIIYGSRKLMREDSDTSKELEIKQAINEQIDAIWAYLQKNPKLILDGMNTRTEPFAGEFAEATINLGKFEALLHSAGGGGTSTSFDSTLKTSINNKNIRTGLNDLLYKIRLGRTSTRYSFTTEKNKQGPHTVARCMGVALRNRDILNLFITDNFTVEKLKPLYEIHLDDIWKNVKNDTYQETYAHCLKTFVNETEQPMLIIAYGQMLIDLHPLATTNTLASGGDIAGKGEGTALANWLKTGSEDEVLKLVDWGSINKNTDKDEQKLYVKYVKNIMAHYAVLRVG